jgi:YD repeat-containing protein
MQQSRATLVTLALLVMFVAPLLPAPVLRAQEAPAIPDVQPTLAEPVFADPLPVGEVPTTTVSTPQPTLAVAVFTDPEIVQVGAWVTVSVQIANRSLDPAEDVIVTLPLPDGVTAGADAPDAQADGWVWNLGTLKGESHMMVSARMRLNRMPRGAALLIEPQVQARWLEVPVRGIGGAVVDERPFPLGRADTGDSPVGGPLTPEADSTRDSETTLATTETPTSETTPATTETPAAPDAGSAMRPTPDPALGSGVSGETRFTPGATTTLRSPMGRVEVQFPSDAAKEALQLTFRFADEAAAHLRAEGALIPPPHPAGYRGFGTIHLHAYDFQGRSVTTFDAPVTIRMRYTPEQLQALDILPGRLTIFWFNPDLEQTHADGRVSRGVWVPLETQIDDTAQIASTTVDHFTAFQLGNGLSPSSAFIPSLQGWQVSSFTGGANYSTALDVPAGPGGMKPNVVLSYASNSDDGPGGTSNKAQASWVGRGWSLDAGGSISRNKNTCCETWDHFVLTAMGHSFDIVRGNHITGAEHDFDGNLANLTEWNWHIVDEAYWRIQPNANNTWTAWSPDGMRYNFNVSLVWGWRSPDRYETYKWLLTSVIDPSGNQITFEYATDPDPLYGTTINPTYRLLRIRWGRDGNPPGTGTSRYRLEFIANNRFSGQTAGVDAQWGFSENQIGTNPHDPNAVDAGRGAPHEKYRLDAVVLYTYPEGTTAQEVTRWQFGYATSANSVTSDGPTGQPMLTLTSFQRGGWNGSGWTYLPATTFTYRRERGTVSPNPPTPGWNRLHTVQNGQGGRMTLTYGHVWSPAGQGGDVLPSGAGYYHGSPYAYRFRVLAMLQEDIANTPYSAGTLTTYAYAGPAVNSRDQSATVLYAEHTPPGFTGNSKIFLARSELGEFRGHGMVVMQVYDGATAAATLLHRTQTWFYQGSAGCMPALLPPPPGGVAYLNEQDGCYQAMLRHEAWKGRVLRQEVQDSSGTVLQRTEHQYAYVPLPFYTSATPNNYTRAGLWRVFTGQIQVIETHVSGAATSSTRTDTFYTGCSAGIPTAYGNPTCVDTYDQQGTRVRRVQYAYAAPAPSGLLLADRIAVITVVDHTGAFLAHTQRFYDTHTTTLGAVGLFGRLVREVKVFNIGGLTASSFVNVQLNGTDATYVYDAWGNVIESRTYAGAGWVKWNGSTWAASAPGNGSAQYTTSTTYHPTFRQLPVQVTYPIAPGGIPLTESAGYDVRMGTITSITDVNNQTTTATYDVHGRLASIRKPGDETGLPTLTATYYDTEQPFRYMIAQRDPSADGRRVTQLFYDGLGRQVQTKLESSTGTSWQTITTDSVYDGLGRVRQASQPRYVTETSVSFAQYTNPASLATMRWTTTSYDLLGRVSRVDVYDPSDASDQQRTTTYAYTLDQDGTGNWLRRQTVTNDRNHQIARSSDSLGRLRKVVEIQSSGNATTRYTYNGLDLLTQVQDHGANLTTMQYDSLGRKTRMEEPNMGGATHAWTYAYWANGNLWRQTDAQGQSICFYYDAMERQTAKQFVSGTTCATSAPATPSVTYTYDQGTSINGRGRLTSTNAAGTGTTWNYDARGRTTRATHTIAGVSGTRMFEWEYERNDLVKWVKYPTVGGGVEHLTYTYDAAWRQTSACSSTCYVTNTTYTALNQPEVMALGNGVPQTWSYTERGFLSRLRVGSATPGNVFDRTYTYDGVGNIASILDNRELTTQTFRYDERDRLTSASAIPSTIASGTTVTVRARGQDGGGWPTMKLRVNGTVVQTWTVNSATWANYTHTLTSALGPTDLVDIVYDNNATSTGDRNLFVESIRFGSATPIPATARTIAYDRHATDGTDVWASDGAMLENGALRLTQRYGYSALGNLSHKEGATFSYGTQASGCAAGALTKPHALVNGGGVGYCYDRNGNMVSGGGRTIAWNTENLPSSVTSGGVTETYTYNAESARVKKVRSGVTTIYLEGLYEEEIGGSGMITKYYTLNGQTVAQRTRTSASTATTTSYLHGDHLGSGTVATQHLASPPPAPPPPAPPHKAPRRWSRGATTRARSWTRRACCFTMPGTTILASGGSSAPTRWFPAPPRAR